jgi:hypothetical protein
LIQRCTSDQVKADQAKAKAEAAAAKAAAIAHLQSEKDRVTAIEDAMQAKEYARSQKDLRPDLHINHKSVLNSDADTLSDSHLILNDLIGISHEPLIDLSLERSLYHSLSHSEDFLTG